MSETTTPAKERGINKATGRRMFAAGGAETTKPKRDMGEMCMSEMCKCGHTWGDHFARHPAACATDDPECECKAFVPAANAGARDFDEWWEREVAREQLYLAGVDAPMLVVLNGLLRACWSASAQSEHRRLRELMERGFVERGLGRDKG